MEANKKNSKLLDVNRRGYFTVIRNLLLTTTYDIKLAKGLDGKTALHHAMEAIWYQLSIGDSDNIDRRRNEVDLNVVSKYHETVRELVSMFLYYNVDLTIDNPIIGGIFNEAVDLSDILLPYIDDIDVYDSYFLISCNNAKLFNSLIDHMDHENFVECCYHGWYEGFCDEQDVLAFIFYTSIQDCVFDGHDCFKNTLNLLYYFIVNESLCYLLSSLHTPQLVNNLMRNSTLQGFMMFPSKRLAREFLELLQHLLFIDNRLSTLFLYTVENIYREKYKADLFVLLQDMNVEIVEYEDNDVIDRIEAMQNKSFLKYSLDLSELVEIYAANRRHVYIPETTEFKMYYFSNKSDIFHEVLNSKPDEQYYPDEILPYYALPVNCPKALEKINARRYNGKYTYFMPSLVELARNAVLGQCSLDRDLHKPFDVVRKVKSLKCPNTIEQILLLRKPIYDIP